MKALVLLSGGIDSTTCLAVAVDKYGSEEVMVLSVFYGQRHDKEMQSARAVAEYYNVRHIELDFEPIFKDSSCSLLKTSEQEVPKKSYAEQLSKTDGKPVSTYVPFRNGLFISAAASIALANGCKEIYYGAHADDSAGNAYPDCSEEFNNAMRAAVCIGSGQQVKIKAPFIDKTKADVVRKGLEFNAPYELTWSCYNGEDKPCGVCGTCIDRQKAFEQNGVKDPALS